MPTDQMQTPRNFPHNMLKEIYEQPAAIEATLMHYLAGGTLDAEPFKQVAEALRGHERLVIAASGSSRHAGLAASPMPLSFREGPLSTPTAGSETRPFRKL